MFNNRGVLILTAALALATVVLSCGEDKSGAEPLIRPVRYEPVYATGGSRVREFAGVVKAGLESELSFKVAGTVTLVAVNVGDEVRPGQLIAALDDADYQLQVQEADASLQQAMAQERNARANYNRVRGLYESRNASKDDLDQARSGAESAVAQVRAAEKRFELARLRLSYTELKAPIAGAIARVDVDTRENVKVGNTVAVLTSGRRMEVEVGIPSILISQIREGDRVMVECDAIGDRTVPARVTEVGVASIGLVTTFPVTVQLEQDAPEMRPGMSSEVQFEFKSGDDRERFLVPSVAVSEDREGRFVFVAEPGTDNIGTAHRRSVIVGEITSEGLEVFEGLVEGDLLITAGVTRLHEGQKVRLRGIQETGQ